MLSAVYTYTVILRSLKKQLYYKLCVQVQLWIFSSVTVSVSLLCIIFWVSLEELSELQYDHPITPW